MKRTKTPATAAPTMTIESVASEYGTPQPSIRIDLGAGTHYRSVHAAMHLLAARVELLSGTERWCVQTKSNDSYEHKGRVYLELASGDAAECARGLAVLRAVVEGDGAALAIARG